MPLLKNFTPFSALGLEFRPSGFNCGFSGFMSFLRQFSFSQMLWVVENIGVSVTDGKTVTNCAHACAHYTLLATNSSASANR